MLCMCVSVMNRLQEVFKMAAGPERETAWMYLLAKNPINLKLIKINFINLKSHIYYINRPTSFLVCTPLFPTFLVGSLSHAHFQTQVINIRLTPVHKYWWVSLLETHTTTTYSKHIHIVRHTTVDSDCPQLESGGNTNKQMCSSSFSFSQAQLSKQNPECFTCIDIKELTSLEFLLLFLLCLLSGQFSLLDLFFSLLSFLILLYCLLINL